MILIFKFVFPPAIRTSLVPIQNRDIASRLKVRTLQLNFWLFHSSSPSALITNCFRKKQSNKIRFLKCNFILVSMHAHRRKGFLFTFNWSFYVLHQILIPKFLLISCREKGYPFILSQNVVPSWGILLTWPMCASLMVCLSFVEVRPRTTRVRSFLFCVWNST